MPETLPAVVRTGLVYGYVRESNDDGMDPEGQMRDCRALAVRYGYDPDAIEWVSDWGQSGRRLDRPGYLRIKADIEAGRVVAVLARSVDRLGRDAQETWAFEALAMRFGTRILTDRDGERTIDPDTVNTIVHALPALLAQEESRLGRDRARRARQTRSRAIESHRATCTLGILCSNPLHHDGRPGYGATCVCGHRQAKHRADGPHSAMRHGVRVDCDCTEFVVPDIRGLVEAFLRTGSYAATARFMNDRDDSDRWEATTVARIVRRLNAERLLPQGTRLPRARRRGMQPFAVHTFSGLVRCPHDGSTLTATWRTTRRGREAGLFCRQGRTTVGHPRPYSVSESVVLDWARGATEAVVSHPVNLVSVVEFGPDAIAELHERRARFAELYGEGSITRQRWEEVRADIDASLARVEAQESALHIGVDWHLPARDLNVRLRQVFSAILLGPGFRPVAGIWLQQPMVEREDGIAVPDDRAVPVEGGWWLPWTPGRRAA